MLGAKIHFVPCGVLDRNCQAPVAFFPESDVNSHDQATERIYHDNDGRPSDYLGWIGSAYQMDVGPRTVDEVEFSGAEDLVTTGDG